MSRLAERIERVPALRLAREAIAAHHPWVVGGAVRDLLLERLPLEDIDFAVPGSAEPAARDLAGAAGAHVFPLSERYGAWRVIARDRSWQADVAGVRGGGIEDDLSLRDFTVNAMAAPLVAPPEPAGARAGTGAWGLVDPHGGARDLEDGILRMVSDRSFPDDPLRTMRMARFAVELDLQVERETRRLAAAHSRAIASIAPERAFYELRRLVCSDDPLRGIELMDEAGLVRELLPELDELKGVEQNPYHHLDVWGHTLEVLVQALEIEGDPQAVLGPAGAVAAAELARPLADGMTRWQALRFGALLHDSGKPATRAVTAEGRVMFLRHDEVGADISAGLARRFRASVAFGDHVAALARHHLRLGFLVHERPLSRRHVYRYLRACDPVALDVTLLSAADRLATRGARTRPEAVEAHLGLARDMASEALTWHAEGPPRPPLTGGDLIAELGLEPGPEVGRLLEFVREAAFAGEIASREDALALSRAEVRKGPGA